MIFHLRLQIEYDHLEWS